MDIEINPIVNILIDMRNSGNKINKQKKIRHGRNYIAREISYTSFYTFEKDSYQVEFFRLYNKNWIKLNMILSNHRKHSFRKVFSKLHFPYAIQKTTKLKGDTLGRKGAYLTNLISVDVINDIINIQNGDKYVSKLGLQLDSNHINWNLIYDIKENFDKLQST